MDAVVLWSGGKDSALACYIASLKGVKVRYLLNMISEDGMYSRSHRISPALIKIQAEAIGIPVIQKKVLPDNYETAFKDAILSLKKEGIDTAVFGDINLQEHRDWIEAVCKDTGIKAVLPLWEEKRQDLLDQFIEAGFKAVIVAVKSDCLGREFLGSRIDNNLIGKLKAMSSIDMCGEKGEYHTFVYDGPLFREPVKFKIGKDYFHDNHHYLEVIGR